MREVQLFFSPISQTMPSGADMVFSHEFDQIREARREDDPTLEQGAWVTEIKLADWPQVLSIAQKVLLEQSKDLRVAGWWCEANTRINGLDGLAQGLQLVAGLCSRYWDSLHPEPVDGDMEERIGSLDWLIANAVQWLREVPVAKSGTAVLRLLDLDMLRSGDGAGQGVTQAEAETVRRNTPIEFYNKLVKSLTSCRIGVESLKEVVDTKLGEHGPVFSVLFEQLERLEHTVHRYAKEAGVVASASTDLGHSADGSVTAFAGETFAEKQAVRVLPGPIASREQAIAQLREVAEFFRQTEPHSPVTYLAEKAARWGEMPLHVWLQRVIKDEGTLLQLQEMLDVVKAPDE